MVVGHTRAGIRTGNIWRDLTITGLESAHANIGDQYEIGDVLLEVTSPRIPCATLAARMDDRGFVKTLNVGGAAGRLLPRHQRR